MISRPDELPGEPNDPSDLVAFTSQQIYLLHDLYGRPRDEINELIRFGFIEVFGADDKDLKPFAHV